METIPVRVFCNTSLSTFRHLWCPVYQHMNQQELPIRNANRKPLSTKSTRNQWEVVVAERVFNQWEGEHPTETNRTHASYNPCFSRAGMHCIFFSTIDVGETRTLCPRG